MAPLGTSGSTHASRLTRPSAHLQMPHVFVIPPEEEQQDNPPWCCFDADELPENTSNFHSNPGIHALDVPYFFQPSENDVPAPIPRRTSVHQPRSVSRKLEKKQRPEAVRIIETRPSQMRLKDGQDDADVIEIVKVKRTREAPADPEENIKAKRSKTLKARATKALQSIKNVGKPLHRTHVKELWTSSESMPGIFKGVQEQIRSQHDQKEGRPVAPPKGSLSRSNSRSLSHIFQPMKPSRLESTFTVRVETPITLTEAPHALPSLDPMSHQFNDTNPSLTEVSDSSPKKNVITKFSVRELHRLFSFASSSTPPPTTISFTPACNETTSSAGTFPMSPSYPDAPSKQDTCPDVHHLGPRTMGRGRASRFHQAPRTHHEDVPGPRYLNDLSFETRLDSLHFDALSFDPEDFDVSMEGDILR